MNDLFNYYRNLPDDELEMQMERMIKLAKSIPLYNQNEDFRRQIAELEKSKSGFSDAVAKEISTKLMGEIEIDKKFKEADEAYDNLRNTLIQGIINNPNNEAAKQKAREIIQIEKDHNQHEPEKWEGIISLL